MGRLDRDPEKMLEYQIILGAGDIPEFIFEYATTPEMRRLAGVGSNCGMNYTRLYDEYSFFYDTLNHSIGVAVITWRFTHDRAATLAALFHDIATPCFKHCIDFLLGDNESQESTEERTEPIVRESKEIRALLERDGVPVEAVLNYKDYWAADNELPKFSADRIDYTLAFGLMVGIWDLSDIEVISLDLAAITNEEGGPEIGFLHQSVAEMYISGAARCWPYWFDSRIRIAMQFVAEATSEAIQRRIFSLDDLWRRPESKIVAKIRESSDLWVAFEEATAVAESEMKLDGLFARHNIQSKRRWTDPYVCGKGRVSKISVVGQRAISEFLAYEPPKWSSIIF